MDKYDQLTWRQMMLLLEAISYIEDNRYLTGEISIADGADLIEVVSNTLSEQTGEITLTLQIDRNSFSLDKHLESFKFTVNEVKGWANEMQTPKVKKAKSKVS